MAKPPSGFVHDRAPRSGVLLVNLGTPEAPTPAAVRRYLAEFLSDRRVVEIPSAIWQPILHGVVLRTRPARSAARYRKIWTNDGSPLAVHSAKQRVLLLGYLGQRLKKAGLPADLCPVEIGMRYGTPSIDSALAKPGTPRAADLLSYAKTANRLVSRFRRFVYAFYDPVFFEVFCAKEPFDNMRAAITTVLSGGVEKIPLKARILIEIVFLSVSFDRFRRRLGFGPKPEEAPALTSG